MDAKTRYFNIKKLALAVVHTATKMKPYFDSHLIKVFMNFSLKQALGKLDSMGRLTKWAIKMGQFEVKYIPRTAIKFQTLMDFVAEYTYPIEERVGEMEVAYIEEKSERKINYLWKRNRSQQYGRRQKQRVQKRITGPIMDVICGRIIQC